MQINGAQTHHEVQFKHSIRTLRTQKLLALIHNIFSFKDIFLYVTRINWNKDFALCRFNLFIFSTLIYCSIMVQYSQICNTFKWNSDLLCRFHSCNSVFTVFDSMHLNNGLHCPLHASLLLIVPFSITSFCTSICLLKWLFYCILQCLLSSSLVPLCVLISPLCCWLFSQKFLCTHTVCAHTDGK